MVGPKPHQPRLIKTHVETILTANQVQHLPETYNIQATAEQQGSQ